MSETFDTRDTRLDVQSLKSRRVGPMWFSLDTMQKGFLSFTTIPLFLPQHQWNTKTTLPSVSLMSLSPCPHRLAQHTTAPRIPQARTAASTRRVPQHHPKTTTSPPPWAVNSPASQKPYHSSQNLLFLRPQTHPLFPARDREPLPLTLVLEHGTASPAPMKPSTHSPNLKSSFPPRTLRYPTDPPNHHPMASHTIPPLHRIPSQPPKLLERKLQHIE